MIEFRYAKEEDATQIANLHYNYISWGFLSTLGADLLKCLYKSLILFPRGVVLVAINDGNIAGFVSAVLALKEYYLYFSKKCLLKIMTIIAFKLLNLSNLRKILENLFYPSKRSEIKNLPKAELLTIVVAKDYQGTNAATSLFQHLREWFKNKGVKEFTTTVGERNLRSAKFFKKMGCELVGTIEIHKGDVSKIFLYREK